MAHARLIEFRAGWTTALTTSAPITLGTSAADARSTLWRAEMSAKSTGRSVAPAPSDHAGKMATEAEHERIRETEDRSWTFALLDIARSPSAPQTERDEAFRTLAHLEDHRAVGPLTAIVENHRLPEPVRDAASKALVGFHDTTSPDRRRAWWESGDPVTMAHALRLMTRSEADVISSVAGDGNHPMQVLALDALAFGFDEPQYQSIKIRALDHPNANVRASAADTLLWAEPVGAEDALITAASDPSTNVAVAAVNALQYYTSRRVLRVLADMRDAENEQVRALALESFDFLLGSFAWAATEGDRAEVAMLREWMEPVRDLVRWPEEIQPKKGAVRSAPVRQPETAVSESELLALLGDLEGEWAPKMRALRNLSWDAFSPDEHDRLATVLMAHPDPEIRSIGCTALVAWSKVPELLTLTADPSVRVRKSAVYHLSLVPRDPAFAEPAWACMAGEGGIAASEALSTYVVHAPVAEARERLGELVRVDRREGVLTRAIGCLVDLGAAPELARLRRLLSKPPGVTWAVHVELLDGFRKLGLPAPPLVELAAVDNLHLFRSVVALRCSTR